MANPRKPKTLSGLTPAEEAITKVDFSALDAFRTEIRKEFGGDSALDDDEFITGFISTGVPPLDFMMGGGFPQGKMSEIAGNEGVGKSSLAIHMLKQVQDLDGLAMIQDTEGGMGDRFRLEHFGVDPKRVIISVEDRAEKVFAQIEKMANFIARQNIKAPCLAIIDSVAGLTTQAELESTMEQGSYGNAKMIAKGIRKTKSICREVNMAAIFVNQSRVKIGGMVNPYTGPEYITPGGDALKFQAIVRLFLTKGKTLGESGKPEGHTINTKFIKCKTAPSLGRTLKLPFYYDTRGYDPASSIYQIFADTKYLGTGAWKTLDMPDGQVKFQGVSEFTKIFNASPENKAHLIELMKTAIREELDFNADQKGTDESVEVSEETLMD